MNDLNQLILNFDYDQNFKDQDFSKIPENTLVFFDDHVNHYERLQQAKFFNIRIALLTFNVKPENLLNFAMFNFTLFFLVL